MVYSYAHTCMHGCIYVSLHKSILTILPPCWIDPGIQPQPSAAAEACGKYPVAKDTPRAEARTPVDPYPLQAMRGGVVSPWWGDCRRWFVQLIVADIFMASG